LSACRDNASLLGGTGIDCARFLPEAPIEIALHGATAQCKRLDLGNISCEVKFTHLHREKSHGETHFTFPLKDHEAIIHRCGQSPQTMSRSAAMKRIADLFFGLLPYVIVPIGLAVFFTTPSNQLQATGLILYAAGLGIFLLRSEILTQAWPLIDRRLQGDRRSW
jgi:hypothetical protein